MAIFRRKKPEQRANDPLSFNAWLDYTFSFNGQMYPITTGMGAPLDVQQAVGSGLEGFTRSFLKGNGIVYACMALRLRIFSDVKFGFRDLADGKPGKITSDLDGRNPASRGLRLLQEPEPGLTTGDLLAHMIQDVDLAGNAFILRQSDRLTRLRPDWMTVLYGSMREDATPWDRDAELMGYMYQEGGPPAHKDPILLGPEEVAHWAPLPDPMQPRIGMSWLTPVVREVLADSSASQHKLSFFNNDATINQQLIFDKGITKEQFELAKEAFNEQHQGTYKAYKTLFALGAELKPVGLDFKTMDFTAIQGRGETRIASAAGIHPVLVAFSEGLQGSSLNAGNFSSARRATADMTFRPLWRNLCGSLSHIIDTPPGKELWYFDDDVQFLQEDRKDAAEIQQMHAATITTYVKEGFDPDSAVAAVMAEDPSLLKHSGLLSVQLQDPTKKPEVPALPPGAVSPPTNGKPPAGNLTPQQAAAAVIAGIERRQPDVIELHASPVEVHTPEINVEGPHIDVQPPEISLEFPEIHVHNDQLPDVTVDMAPVREAIETAEAAAAKRHGEVLEGMKPKPVTRTIERDEDGLLVRVVDEVDV